MTKHSSIRITGKVQGVFFRASAKDKADELDVKGFVCNEPDGSVYLEAEGEEASLEQLIQWCWTGPPRARIDKIDVGHGDVKNFKSFEIKR